MTLRPPYLRDCPSWTELMRDPAWRALHTAAAPLPFNLRRSDPWAVWMCAETDPAPDGRPRWTWGRRDLPNHAEAWNYWVQMRRRKPRAVDWAITCRSYLWPRPAGLVWDSEIRLAWCPRCRRPVLPLAWGRHRAVHDGAPGLPPSVRMRCPYCGVADAGGGGWRSV